jgi:hypothetical protein
MEDKEMQPLYNYSFTTYRAREKVSSPWTYLSINDQMIHILADFVYIPHEWWYQAIFTCKIIPYFGPVSLLLELVLNFTQSLPYQWNLATHPTLNYVCS